MVSCTAIEAQVVFEMHLVLVTGQLAVASQFGREVHPQSIRLLLGSGGQSVKIVDGRLYFIFSFHFILLFFSFSFLIFYF